MGFWPLILLLLAGIFLSVATFCILASTFRDNAPHRLHLWFAAGLTTVALILLLFSTRLGVGIDQKALAKNIADDIRSVPLKVEIAGNGASTAVDESSLANAIAERLRAAPLDVQVTKEPAFDNAALAKAIVEQLPLKLEIVDNGHIATLDEIRLADAIAARLRAAPLDVQVTKVPPFDNAALALAIAEHLPPRASSPLLIDSRTVTGIGVLGLIAFSILFLLRLPPVRFLLGLPSVSKPLWKDWPTLITLLVGLGGILSARFWPPPPDPKELVVTFDNSGHGSAQAFFEASSLEHPIRFAPGDDSPPREAVCAAMHELTTHGSTVAIVVGSHDQQPLSADATLRFSSNAGLARRRAEGVKNILVGDTKPPCNSPSIGTVIALSDSALNVGTRNISSTDFEKDRAVRVFGLTATRFNRANYTWLELL